MRQTSPQSSRTLPPVPRSLLLLCALWLGAPALARAAEGAGARVLLVERGRDPFLERVGAEVEGLGFSLVRSDANGPLEASARAEHAAAAIRVLPSRKGVEVWMADATSGRSLLRQVIVDESPGGPDRDLVALQTAELLRTSLLGEKAPQREAPTRDVSPPATSQSAAQGAETRQSEKPSGGELQPEAPTRAAPQAEAPRHEAPAKATPGVTTASSGIGVGFGTLFSPGGTNAAIELGVSAHHFFGERWGVGLDVGIPLRPGAVSGVEGSANMGAYTAGASLLAQFPGRPAPLFGRAGIGAGALILNYDGEAHAPLRSNSGTRATFAGYLRGDVGVEAASFLRVGLRALVGVGAERISVMFAGNDAGTFGPVFLAAYVFAELPLP